MAAEGWVSLSGKLKLLFILDAFPDPQAGTEGQFWLLFKQLDRDRVDPAIVLLRPSEWLQTHATDVPIRVLDIKRLRSWSSLRKILATIFWARRGGFQMAHIFFNDSALVFPPLLKLTGVRVIVSRRDLGFWYTPANLKLLRFNAFFIDAVVANAHAVKAVVQHNEDFAEDKIHVIYNGIRRVAGEPSRGLRDQLDIPPTAPLLAIVANLRPLKRIDDVIRALAKQHGEGRHAHLLVIGEDRPGKNNHTHRQELKELAISLSVEKRVHFIGKVTDPMPLLMQASICLLCSETEGLSNAIIEYMLAGCPVVCTDVGGNVELVQHENNGFIVPVGDIDAISAALDTLLSDSELLRQMGEQSKHRAQSMFLPSAMVDAHVRLYARLQKGTS
jgi:glycosyltransferase involved in cell wall biosynthesis